LRVFSKAAEVGLYNLHDFVLTERGLIEPPFYKLLFEGVSVLALEDEIIGFFIAAISIFLDFVMCVQFGDGLTFSALVLIYDFLHPVAARQRIGGNFMESAELVGGAMQQIRMGFH